MCTYIHTYICRNVHLHIHTQVHTFIHRREAATPKPYSPISLRPPDFKHTTKVREGVGADVSLRKYCWQAWSPVAHGEVAMRAFTQGVGSRFRVSQRRRGCCGTSPFLLKLPNIVCPLLFLFEGEVRSSFDFSIFPIYVLLYG